MGVCWEPCCRLKEPSAPNWEARGRRNSLYLIWTNLLKYILIKFGQRLTCRWHKVTLGRLSVGKWIELVNSTHALEAYCRHPFDNRQPTYTEVKGTKQRRDQQVPKPHHIPVIIYMNFSIHVRFSRNGVIWIHGNNRLLICAEFYQTSRSIFIGRVRENLSSNYNLSKALVSRGQLAGAGGPCLSTVL